LTTSSTGKKPEAYVDTSALISFLDRSDSHHFLFRRLFASPPKLVTTPLVVAEGHSWFLRRFDRTRALQFLAVIDDMRPLRVLSLAPRDLSEAAEVLRHYHDQDLTLVDALGLHVMTDRRIRSCWSTDFHLSLAGAHLVIHGD
jgi:predicted nucleic acid-binding protein